MKALESLKKLSISHELAQSKDGNLRKEIDPITTAALVVAAVCAIYKVAVFLFGYHKTVDYIDIPMERGFEYFNSEAIVNYVYDIPLEKVKKVQQTYSKVLDILPYDKKNNDLMNDLFDYIEFQEMAGWSKQDLLYQTKQSPNYVRYASVVAKKDVINGKTVYHFLLMTTFSTFRLAKTLKMKVTHEGFGIVSNKMTSELVENETDIVQQDFDDIIKFYNFVCLKAMASYFNQRFDFPKLQKRK